MLNAPIAARGSRSTSPNGGPLCLAVSGSEPNMYTANSVVAGLPVLEQRFKRSWVEGPCGRDLAL